MCARVKRLRKEGTVHVAGDSRSSQTSALFRPKGCRQSCAPQSNRKEPGRWPGEPTPKLLVTALSTRPPVLSFLKKGGFHSQRRRFLFQLKKHQTTKMTRSEHFSPSPGSITLTSCLPHRAEVQLHTRQCIGTGSGVQVHTVSPCSSLGREGPLTAARPVLNG